MTGSTTRKTRAERRAEIAKAALEIIGRRGLPALTTTALADHIGVTSGALFRHFASREAILEEAVRIAETQIDATFPDPSLPAMTRLRELALARIGLLSEEPGLAWLFRSEQALLTLPPAAVRRLRALARRSRTYMSDALDEAIQEGRVRADIPADLLLLTFTATVHALIGHRSIQGRSTRSPEITRAVEGLFDLIAPVGTTIQRK